MHFRQIKNPFLSFGLNLGELIGVEYLYDQTQEVLGEYCPDDAEGDEVDDDDEAYQEDEAGLDPTIPPLDEAVEPPKKEAPAKASKCHNFSL